MINMIVTTFLLKQNRFLHTFCFRGNFLCPSPILLMTKKCLLIQKRSVTYLKKKTCLAWQHALTNLKICSWRFHDLSTSLQPDQPLLLNMSKLIHFETSTGIKYKNRIKMTPLRPTQTNI